MASWQASLASLLYRLTAKSAIRSHDSIEGLRRQMQRFNAVFGKLPADVRVEPVQFPTFDADWISVPESDPRRVILHFPGGAYVMGFPPIHRALVARICREARARALLVHYRLAPEDPYPAGLRDCMTAYRAVLDQDVPANHIVIGGDSAGGGMALSSLLALRDESTPLPACVYLLSAVADLTDPMIGSRRENRWRDSMLPASRCSELRNIYLNHDESLLRHPHVSPIYGDFTGFPPMLFQVGDTEILRDDSVRVAEKAKAAGVATEVEIWENLPHVWHLLEFLPESKRALLRLGDFVRRCTLEIDFQQSPNPARPTRKPGPMPPDSQTKAHS